MRHVLPHPRPLSRLLARAIHNSANHNVTIKNSIGSPVLSDVTMKSLSPLSRMRTKTLVRSLVLTWIMGQNWIMRPSLAMMNFMIQSSYSISNPDKNPILNKVMRLTLYNHFSAGENAREIRQSSQELKDMGYQGVILGYAREVVLKNPKKSSGEANGARYQQSHYDAVAEWKDNNLKTLDIIGKGDFLAVKATGAGPIANDALKAMEPMPESISKALDEICERAKAQGSRILIDAEQQALQLGLDEWAIELMRKHNRNGNDSIYNTIQAYLKASKANAERQIKLAAREGWNVSIKLVRGAYIENDVRSLIHDTKEDTDSSYDSIAEMMISQKLPPGENLAFPQASLFLATHNASSAEKALKKYHQRAIMGQHNIKLECGQIMGMADELSCDLLQKYEAYQQDPKLRDSRLPGVYKALHWGTVKECMGYLYRRAVENRGATERTAHMVSALWQELCRRLRSPIYKN